MTIRIIGHRGARGLFPENTREGFDAAAVRLGVTCFELDVASTRDGIAVVHHDPALNPDTARGSDGTWIDPTEERPLLRHLLLAELQGYDVGRLRPGSPTAAQFPDQQPWDGARVPLLRDVLAGGGAACEWFVEIKTFPDQPHLTLPIDELTALAVGAADDAGATSRCTFLGFDWRALRWLRSRRADVRLAWSTRPETLAQAPLWLDLERPVTVEEVPTLIADEGGGSWAPHHAALTPALVEASRKRGVAPVPWTVNDAGRMRDLLAFGVEALITDYPDRLRQILDEADQTWA